MRGTAVIAGAGIAGLAAARSLTAAGWEVQVHERHPQLSTAGTLLGLWPAAWAALERLGIASALETVSLSSGELLRPDGRVLVRLALPGTTRGVGRMDLLETLLAGLPEGTVRWSSPASSPAALPDADVVVAADGVHSALRARAFPAARLRDARVVAFRGVAPLETREGFEAWGAGLIFGRAPSRAAAATGTPASAPTSRGPAGRMRSRSSARSTGTGPRASTRCSPPSPPRRWTGAASRTSPR
ncbi:NAD(P)-binding protein [Sinomonas atrocyanea]